MFIVSPPDNAFIYEAFASWLCIAQNLDGSINMKIMVDGLEDTVIATNVAGFCIVVKLCFCS
jgi:hypothetical protein